MGRTRYRFTVENPEHRSHGVASAELDGIPVDARAIPLREDGGEHEVRIVLGSVARGAREGLPGPRPPVVLMPASSEGPDNPRTLKSVD